MRHLIFTLALTFACLVAVVRIRAARRASWAIAEGWTVAQFRMTSSFRTPAVGRHRRPGWWAA